MRVKYYKVIVVTQLRPERFDMLEIPDELLKFGDPTVVNCHHKRRGVAQSATIRTCAGAREEGYGVAIVGSYVVQV